MKALMQRIRARFQARLHRPIRIAAMQPLANGVCVFATDMDGRRIVFAASTHAICVLDRYPCPSLEGREEPPPAAA